MSWKNKQIKDEVITLCKSAELEFKENEKESLIHIQNCRVYRHKADVLVNIKEDIYTISIWWNIGLVNNKQRLNLLELNNKISRDQVYKVYFEDCDNEIEIYINSQKLIDFITDFINLASFAERYAKAIDQILLGKDCEQAYKEVLETH